MIYSQVKKHRSLIIVLIFPLISLIIALYTLSHYGINWDEPYHYRRGQAFLHFFITGEKTYQGLPKYPPLKGTTDTPGFRNSDQYFSATQNNTALSDPTFRRSYYQDDAWDGRFFIDEEWSYGHPALNDVLASLFNYIFYQKLGILGDIESYHLFIISIVSLASFIIAIFIWKEFGVIESVFTSLALATYPLLLGEQHFNIKDPVQMSFYTVTLIFAFLGIKTNRLSWLFTSLFFFGLALSTKFNIAFFVPIFLLWIVYYFLKENKNIHKASLTKNLAIAAICAPLVILGILFVSYPTLWRNPMNELVQIIKFYLDVGFSQSQPSEYYFGFFNTYPITWIIYTTPPIILLLLIYGMISLKEINKKSSFVFLAVIWLVVTIGRISFFGATSYGGARLIMEYIPALAILAGISAGFLTKKINSRYRILIIFLLLTGFLPTIIKLVQIHPQENVYFNALAGGLIGAKEKGLNSWGNSYGNAYYPALNWMNQNSEENSKLTLPINSTVNIPRYKLRPDIAVSDTYWSGPEHKGEYVLELTHDYAPMHWFSLKYLNSALNPVYEVKVDGVAIAKLWKNDTQHVKDEYKRLEVIEVAAGRDGDNRIIINLPQNRRIMKVSLKSPTTDCLPIKTGFVVTSKDNITFSREPEDIARDQLKQAAPRGISTHFDFHFVAREAKTIIFDVANSDACLLKSTSGTVTLLK